jgi:hypothetical protein
MPDQPRTDLHAGADRAGREDSVFGQRGVKIPLLFYLINMLVWAGLPLVMFGNGIRNILGALGYETGEWVVGAGGALGNVTSTVVVRQLGLHPKS